MTLLDIESDLQKSYLRSKIEIEFAYNLQAYIRSLSKLNQLGQFQQTAQSHCRVRARVFVRDMIPALAVAYWVYCRQLE
jgi:hypothetical protein